MLSFFGVSSLEAFAEKVIPSSLCTKIPLTIAPGKTETEALHEASTLAAKNQLWRTFIGLGYYGTITPSPIRRNIFENPAWYTAYTPYQPEISQGRLEALLNYQTLVCELTGLAVSNASLLDEGTAAGEALGIALTQWRTKGSEGTPIFLVSDAVFPQTKAVLATRAYGFGVELRSLEKAIDDSAIATRICGGLVQYPNSFGEVLSPKEIITALHAKGALAVVASDLLALTLLPSPGELGADIALGNSQRFGVPLGYGGPHAAFFAVKDELKRLMPGRLVGVSKDARGKPALRLSLQTREQHIRREKATSNICTSQVLLAVMASMYAVYHGPEGLRSIARQVHEKTVALAQACASNGLPAKNHKFFDTLHFENQNSGEIKKRAEEKRINLYYPTATSVQLSLDETVEDTELSTLVYVLTGKNVATIPVGTSQLAQQRKTAYLSAPVFSKHHTETTFMRYVKSLEMRDISLVHSMIPLGSCTMKLNAASSMFPVGFAGFSSLHPFVPEAQAEGYETLCRDLESWLCDITGFEGASLQPNAGSQGEYAGLIAIRQYLESKGEQGKNITLIPKSAHGTNPASAAMAGLEVAGVECDSDGNISIPDLEKKIAEHAGRIACVMVTYPSTHGVFEESIKKLCELVHAAGAQVYMDGANLNAQVGVMKAAELGADVCHINLHKTFSIPHGGGGPGMGPICVRKHLIQFLPSHPFARGFDRNNKKGHTISAAPYGSASILPISWMYTKMLGGEGLRTSTLIALLNANYIAKKLQGHFETLYKSKAGFVAHECIIDARPFKQYGIEAEDIAKRLMDYGFHAPTLSWPVVGTLMVEPTESESKGELDRFCEAMIAIREEIRNIEHGKFDKTNNPLKHAPHTVDVVIADEWTRPYSRKDAAFPASWSAQAKVWPFVARIDGVYGDRNLVCTCGDVSDHETV